MFSYFVYGLGIRSALPLPELECSETGIDVVVRLGKVGHLPSEVTPEGTRFRVSAEEVCFFYAEVGAFLVRREEIVVDPAKGVEERVLRLFILGPALAALLHQRGLLVLHASAVTVNGGTVAFLGGSGWGKSTLATALYARGHSVVADDVTAVQVDGGSPTVLPGFPQLKLWPEAAAASGYIPEALPRLHPRLEKRAFCVTRRFSQSPLPLRRIYVLAEGTHQEVEPLRPQEALVELVRHSYTARLLESTGTAASHFLQCARLANRVPICRLKRPRSLAALPDLARLVEEDIARTLC